MGNSVTFSTKEKSFSDSSGNRIAGQGISCSDNSFVKLDEQEQEEVNFFAGVVKHSARKDEATIDIGELESPLEHFCSKDKGLDSHRK